jgi:hypothetical protein
MVMVCAPDAKTLLSVWERAYGSSPTAQGLVLSAIAAPHESPERLVRWSIGRRDGALLTLRARLFGPDLRIRTTCPACNDGVELAFSVDDIRAAEAQEDSIASTLGTSDRRIRLRPPNSEDLFAVEGLTTATARRRALIERCVQPETTDDAPWSPDEAEERLVAERLAESDPQADIRLAVDCPACRHAWSAPFDIVSFLWKELDVWAQRLLADVHSLASAYGWSEESILEMSPWRRQAYLEMLRR